MSGGLQPCVPGGCLLLFPFPFQIGSEGKGHSLSLIPLSSPLPSPAGCALSPRSLRVRARGGRASSVLVCATIAPLPPPSCNGALAKDGRRRTLRNGGASGTRDWTGQDTGCKTLLRSQGRVHVVIFLQCPLLLLFKHQCPSNAPPLHDREMVSHCREDVITDLEEQIAELTDMMEQLRRDHQASRKLLEKDMEEKCNEMQQEHENKIRELHEAHRAELQALQEYYKKELKTERATAQEKMEGMQKEYKYLKNAFRMYQDSVSDEMEEKWLRRQADWKKSERTEREKALLQQKQELMKKFEREKEQLRKSFRSGDAMMNKDIEDYIKQHQADEKKIQELQSIKESLAVELKEKDQILTALTATMQNTQVELKKEKSNLLAMEKSIQEKISAVELKHQLNISSLTDENVVLRRKLITKNEEAYNERVRRNESNVKTAVTGM